MKKHLTIEYDRAKNGKYVVRIRARNNEIVLSGETTERKARRMITGLIIAIQHDDFDIVDLTKSKK